MHPCLGVEFLHYYFKSSTLFHLYYKTILHTRHDHNLPCYVAFVDLVKAFDTVNLVTMFKILERYGASPKLRSAISRMYQDLKVVLKIGKIEEKMSQTVEVRQGDCMAHVMFLFMVIVFAETLETEWIKEYLRMINLRQHTHSTRDVGKLTGHNKNNFEQDTLLSLFFVLYVDDSVFTFEYRNQLTRGLNLIYQHFTRF